jgi:hypothetical protein
MTKFQRSFAARGSEMGHFRGKLRPMGRNGSALAGRGLSRQRSAVAARACTATCGRSTPSTSPTPTRSPPSPPGAPQPSSSSASSPRASRSSRSTPRPRSWCSSSRRSTICDGRPRLRSNARPLSVSDPSALFATRLGTISNRYQFAWLCRSRGRRDMRQIAPMGATWSSPAPRAASSAPRPVLFLHCREHPAPARWLRSRPAPPTPDQPSGSPLRGRAPLQTGGGGNRTPDDGQQQ